MSNFGPDADQPEKMMIVYFKRESGAAAKTFAQHLRARGGIKVNMIWGQAWRGDESVMAVGAIVLEQGVPNEEAIRAAYERHSPDTEIHYMTSEGQWADVGSEDSNPAGQPEPVQAEDPTPEAEAGNGVVESEEPDDISDVEGFNAADDAAAGDSEDTREA